MQQQDNHEYPFLYQRQTCHQVQPNQATYQKRQKCQPATYLQEVLAPLPPETELSRQMTTSTTSIDIMGLQAAYANLHTDQERDYFMQRYHDVISSFGGKTSYDADNRPL